MEPNTEQLLETIDDELKRLEQAIEIAKNKKEHADKNVFRLHVAFRYEYGEDDTVNETKSQCVQNVRKAKCHVTTLQYYKTHIVDETSYEQCKKHKIYQLYELLKCLNKKLINYRKYNLQGIKKLEEKIWEINIDIDRLQRQNFNDFIETNNMLLNAACEQLDTFTNELNNIVDDIDVINSMKKKAADASKVYDMNYKNWQNLKCKNWINESKN
jgi:hypothetical protein